MIKYPNVSYEFKEIANAMQITFYKTTQENTQEIKVKVSTRELIIKYIKENDKITREALALKIGVSSSAIKQQLAKLKQDKRLKRIGSTKSGYWKVNL